MNQVSEAQAAHLSPSKVPSVLTREVLETGGMADLIARDAPGLRLLTESEREESLQIFLQSRPAGDIWVFGYGSLIWNLGVKSAERQVARVNDWHRSFCLSITAGRASPENPGLMLALDKGGFCFGTADRILASDLENELRLIWRREMCCGAYTPHWVDLIDRSNATFGKAIAFTVDQSSSQYVGDATIEVVAKSLAIARGSLGTAADYLFRTVQSLRKYGIPDTNLEFLARRVQAVQAIE